MKILVLGCTTMREGVLAAIIFFVSGVLMILASTHIIPNVAYMQHIVMLIGFLLLLFTPIILISTFLLAVIPGAKEKLDKCEH